MMTIKMSSNGLRFAFFTLIFVMILIPFHTTFAQNSEGITIDKDVFFQRPIQSPEDLPDEVTFSLYDSEDSLVPLATQSFPRGEYILDFDFNKSDGLLSGSVARFKVNFTNKLNLDTDAGESKQPKEIWVEFSVNDDVVGNRTCVPDEAMVQLLLASDAAIATYLTLAYEGDDNPITTIYKDLPLASASGFSANDYINSLFRTSSATDVPIASTSSPYWEYSGGNIFYDNGKVGIGTTTPARSLHVQGASTTVRIDRDADTVGFMLHRFPTGDFTTPWKGFLVGVNASGPDDGYFMISDYAQAVGGASACRFLISNAGNVGIGLGTTMPSNALDVYGTIRCKELIVTSTWADFVFEDNYKLPTLDEVEDFISKNKHLPGIPSEAEVKEKGVSIGSISSKLLQKIEELTLYVIDVKKENDLLKGQLATIQKQLDKVTK